MACLNTKWAYGSAAFYVVVYFLVCPPSSMVSSLLLSLPFLYAILTTQLLDGRAALRYGFIGTVGVATACSAMLFIYLLATSSGKSPDSDSFLQVFALLVLHFLSTVFAAVGFACLSASSNRRFLAHILQGEHPEELFPISPKPTVATYFLNALLRPSYSVSRMREHIEPTVGSFHVRSEIEFDIPNELLKSRSLYLPVVFQGKCELTRELVTSNPQGLEIRKLNDEELNRLICEALQEVISGCGWKDIDNSKLSGIVDEALSSIFDCEDNEFYRRCGALNKGAGITKRDQAAFLAAFFEAVRFVKPICYKVAMCDNKPIGRQHIVLNVNRIVPLVPVRQLSSHLFMALYIKVKRLLTKKRLHFYYGLGNADCAKSYHLSFEGLPNTYLSDFQIVGVGERDEFFICEDISVSTRYDQQYSRLYIRNGRGFSRAAIDVSFERRSQRPVVVLLVSGLACLLVTAYLYFTSVVGEHDADLFRPLTILSIGTLVTAWQAMEEYRAEEWLWLCISAVAITSFCVIVGLLCNKPLHDVFGSFLRWPWLVCLTIEFLVTHIATLALVSKLKLHGCIVDRVPRVRKALRLNCLGIEKQNFQSMIESQRNRLSNLGESASSESDNDISSFNADGELQDLAPSRIERYKKDMWVYRQLFSKNWIDGWLMPSWSSSMNPFRMPSLTFCEWAAEILSKCDSEQNAANNGGGIRD